MMEPWHQQLDCGGVTVHGLQKWIKTSSPIGTRERQVLQSSDPTDHVCCFYSSLKVIPCKPV